MTPTPRSFIALFRRVPCTEMVGMMHDMLKQALVCRWCGAVLIADERSLERAPHVRGCRVQALIEYAREHPGDVDTTRAEYDAIVARLTSADAAREPVTADLTTALTEAFDGFESFAHVAITDGVSVATAKKLGTLIGLLMDEQSRAASRAAADLLMMERLAPGSVTDNRHES
jgi:hypothetical protein